MSMLVFDRYWYCLYYLHVAFNHYVYTVHIYILYEYGTLSIIYLFLHSMHNVQTAV